jgi:cobalamin biosynthesis Mg chelatase CobN
MVVRALVVFCLGVLAAGGLASCGGGGGTAALSNVTVTRTVVQPTAPAATDATTAEDTTTEDAGATVTETVVHVTTVVQTATQAHTVTQTPTATHTETVLATTTEQGPVKTVAVAAAAATQPDETDDEPWGWIAFGILAAAVAVGAIVWGVRRKPKPG